MENRFVKSGYSRVAPVGKWRYCGHMSQIPGAFSIALLAGGKSSRMGRDKGLILFMGKPLFLYILNQLLGLSDDIILITNQPINYQGNSYRILPDVMPGIGALGGIHSALSYAQHDLCFIFACDMPFISGSLIFHLLKEVEGFDVAIPQSGADMLEPFRAVYRKTCLGVVEAAIQAGERRAIGFLPKVKTKRIPKSTLIQLDPNLESFLNINTPKDLIKIEAIAKVKK